MAAPVERGIIGLCGLRRPKRKKEHAPFRAKGLFIAWRMPSLTKSFGREHDQRATRLENLVAAKLFARAHERSRASPAGADARGPADGLAPLGTILGPFARTFERFGHGQLEQCHVAVGEPFTPGESDTPHLREIAAVLLAQPRPTRVFANIPREGGELPLGLHNPIMPARFENLLAQASHLCITPLQRLHEHADDRLKAQRNERPPPIS